MTISKNQKTPNLHFLFQHPRHLLALGFGSGLAPKAPGTFGTILGLAAFGLIAGHPLWLQLIIIALLFLIGISICGETAEALGTPDHGSIVWDEIVPFWGVLWLLSQVMGDNLLWQGIAFAHHIAHMREQAAAQRSARV